MIRKARTSLLQQSKKKLLPFYTSSICHDTGWGKLQTVEDCHVIMALLLFHSIKSVHILISGILMNQSFIDQ